MSVNPEYSKFLLGVRYALVIISFIANFFYIRRLKLIPYGDIIVEQKFILILGLLLILFNDPFAGLTVLYPNIARLSSQFIENCFKNWFLVDFSQFSSRWILVVWFCYFGLLSSRFFSFFYPETKAIFQIREFIEKMIGKKMRLWMFGNVFLCL